MQTMKEMLQIAKSKTYITMLMAIALVMAMAGSASANTDGTGIDQTVVTGAVQNAVSETISLMAALLPIALTLLATTWGVRKAIRFFKGAAN